MGILVSVLNVEGKNPDELKVPVSDLSEVKKYYFLTKHSFIENKSRISDFKEMNWRVPEIVKKCETHINEAVLPMVAPSMPWPPEDYNDGAKYPIDTFDLKFDRMELETYKKKYAYWKVVFHLSDPIATGRYEMVIVCYLNGNIATLVGQDKNKGTKKSSKTNPHE